MQPRRKLAFMPHATDRITGAMRGTSFQSKMYAHARLRSGPTTNSGPSRLRLALGAGSLGLWVLITALSANAHAQHVEIGGFGDYENVDFAPYPKNAFGLGGRADFNLHRFLQVELETAYDVKHSALAIRGVLAIVFALLILFSPGISLASFAILFGAFTLIDGIFLEMAASRGATETHEALYLEGTLSVFAGVLTLIWPTITNLVLLYMVAFWAIMTGVLELVTGILMSKWITRVSMFLLMGITSLLFGLFVILTPAAGALAITVWIGGFVLLFGLHLLVVACRLREYHASSTQFQAFSGRLIRAPQPM
jgi:uncharacterized membrane protein HdeD (DUF308 family)